MRLPTALAALAAALLICTPAVHAAVAAVQVDLSPSELTLEIGQTATLTVYATVASGLATTNNGIFGWDVDLLNSDSSVVALIPATLSRAGWTNTASTSSAGTAYSWGIDAIYDTSESDKTRGLGSPATLFTIQFQALQLGVSTLSIASDTTTGADFITWNGNTYGDYGSAVSQITVVPEPATAVLLMAAGVVALGRARCAAKR
jgi:hypothetical protein